MTADTGTLPPLPPGCAWLALREYAHAVGLPYSTAHEHAQTGLMDGAARPLAHKAGGHWLVQAPIVPLPDKRRAPAAPTVDAQALARDLAAALAPYLRTT